MQFTQIEFYVILFIVLLAVYFGTNSKLKKIVIIITSMYFYAYFDYRLLALLILANLSTYYVGKMIQLTVEQSARKKLLLFGLFVNILILAIFKYLNFFIEGIVKVIGPGSSMPHLNIILPIGVSFYTFRFISYLVDLYKGQLKSSSLMDFMVYGTFFPIIVSGPISRAQSFFPQILNIETTIEKIYQGYKLFIVGLFLKVFIADKIAMFVNFFYENYSVFDVTTTWLAVLSYSIQIYCDFAGYSSMAIGLSLMLGIQIEDNFNFPYLSKNISEFWKRWHITLSRWIRDYLYIPLGGSKKGKQRKVINLLLAMSLCGLWHGAAWTFVFWGFLHGILLVINHSWKGSRFEDIKLYIPRIYGFLSWFLTFISITICWVFFRSSDFGQAFDITIKLFSINTKGISWINPFAIFALSLVFSIHLLEHLKIKIATILGENRLAPVVLFGLIWLVVVFFPKEFQPFVYAQF